MKYQKILGVLIAATLFQGCATDQGGRKLDEKVNQQPVSLNRADVHKEVTEWISNSSILSPAEKQRLFSLRDSTALQENALQEKSLKLRSILIKELLSTRYDRDEVAIAQQELKSVEHERLAVFFGAVREANRVLGRWGSRSERQSEQFYDDMMREVGPPGFYF